MLGNSALVGKQRRSVVTGTDSPSPHTEPRPRCPLRLTRLCTTTQPTSANSHSIKRASSSKTSLNEKENMSDDADEYHIETADAGASATIPMEAGQIKKGG